MTVERQQKKIGEILIEMQVLTRENLSLAIEVQGREGGLLGEILVRLKMVKEQDVALALATQFNFPYLPLENFAANKESAEFVPKELALKYRFIPIDKTDDILTVVMSDPSDADTITEIAAMTKCRIRVFVGALMDIENAIRRLYRLTSGEVSKMTEQTGEKPLGSTEKKPTLGRSDENDSRDVPEEVA